VTPNKGNGPQFREPAYISEINELRRSNLTRRYPRIKTETPAETVSLGVAGEDGASNSNFFQNSGIVRIESS